MDFAAALSQVEIFSDLSEEALSSLAESVKVQTLVSGETLYSEGEPPRLLYILVHGRLQVTAKGKILGYINRHELVGEMGVVAARRVTPQFAPYATACSSAFPPARP